MPSTPKAAADLLYGHGIGFQSDVDVAFSVCGRMRGQSDPVAGSDGACPMWSSTPYGCETTSGQVLIRRHATQRTTARPFYDFGVYP